MTCIQGRHTYEGTEKMHLTWRELQTAMANLTESEVAALLIEEVTLHKRAPFITRLHQRYARLRADRERQEILRMTQK